MVRATFSAAPYLGLSVRQRSVTAQATILVATAAHQAPHQALLRGGIMLTDDVSHASSSHIHGDDHTPGTPHTETRHTDEPAPPTSRGTRTAYPHTRPLNAADTRRRDPPPPRHRRTTGGHKPPTTTAHRPLEIPRTRKQAQKQIIMVVVTTPPSPPRARTHRETH